MEEQLKSSPYEGEGGPKDHMRGLKIRPEAIHKNTEEEFYND